MAFCPNCGTPVNKNDLFCRNCGVSLESDKRNSNQMNQPTNKINLNHAVEKENPKDMAFVTISVGKDDLFEEDSVGMTGESRTSSRVKADSNVLAHESMQSEMPVVQLGLHEDFMDEMPYDNSFLENEKNKWRSLSIKIGIGVSVFLTLAIAGIFFLKLNPDFFARIVSNQHVTTNGLDSLDQPIVDQASNEEKISSNQSLLFKEIDEKENEVIRKKTVKFKPSDEQQPSQLTELDTIVKKLFAETIENTEGNHALYFQKLTNRDGNFVNEEPLIINSEAFTAEGLIKIMLMVTYYQRLKEGELDPEQTYTLVADDIVGGTGILQNQEVGSVYTLEELVELMIIASDNTAMNVLVDYVGGVGAVNQTIQSYGFTKSVLNHKIFEDTDRGDNYISIDELGFLFAQLYQKQLVQENYDHDMLIMLNRQRDNNMLTENMPDELIYYNKTGNADEYGIKHDATIIETEKGAYILISLNDKVGVSEEENEAFRGLMQQFGKQVYDTVVTY